jgi:3-methyladenine DNA glycosylase/8-oxoguanine DNA glycosylase
MTSRPAQRRLVGAGGEPVDLARTLASHGFADLPPLVLDEEARTLELTFPHARSARTVRIGPGRRGYARVEPIGRAFGRDRDRILDVVAHVLRLDEDLSGFYEAAASDPDLKWVTGGAGRMLRSPTVFEDVVKTICTTNCAWSATVRMVGALVDTLGPKDAAAGRRAFPTPAAMADADEAFYRDVVRAGYRGPYLRALAASVADGSLDLEALSAGRSPDLPDDEVEASLLALPGVGPYAAAHIMMLLGRYSRLILDSWTRPTYARVTGARKTLADRTIERRFRRYGRYAGLAFWLVLTREWVKEADAETEAARASAPR